MATKENKNRQTHEPKGVDVQVLLDAMRDNFSPQAVAAMVLYLQGANTKNAAVNREVQWFAGELANLVGGSDAILNLANEIGL